MYPPKELIFNCFNFFNISDTKVIILGQDPYIREGEAMGLSFSIPSNIKVPPSLKNIYKEINRDLNADIPLKESGDLTHWAEQGVLLLNCALTVIEGKSGSHSKLWYDFASYIIKAISDNTKNCVFFLWGNHAISKEEFISPKNHLILSAGHPSPLNRKKNFIGNNHFSLANKYLEKHDKKAIDWSKIKYK
jgi:uracil-DNA glycosylase